MCGRYASSRSPEDLVEEFEVVESRIGGPLAADYNVAPTKEVYAVVERPWAKDPSIGSRMINARMETVAEKPAYRKAFASRRALLPADGYFEWYPTSRTDAKGKPVKQPFFIRPRDGGILAMAGLYEIWRDPSRAEDDPDRFRWTCTVLTTEAEDSLGHIHDRMPLMVERERWHEWLDPTTPGDTALLVPAAPGRLEAYAVPSLVSNVRNNGPELVEPLEATT